MMKSIKIFDTNFSHEEYSSSFQSSRFITWDRSGGNVLESEPVFYTDLFLEKADKSHPFNVGMLLEPPAINSSIYSKIPLLLANFERVFTYERNLLESNSKFSFYPHGGCWIKTEDMKIYPKDKLVSIIASEKNATSGHRLRHKIISACGDKIEVFGRGYESIPYKLPALQDFMYSFVIENSKIDYYFTEKLIDCLVTGTIPIYYGCPSIHKFFNPNGFITFDSVEDLPKIFSELNSKDYESKIPYIKENFEKALEFILSEDWIYQNTNIFKS